MRSRAWPILLIMLLTAACEDRTAPEPQDQWVRPARIFVVEDTTETTAYSFVGRVEALQTIDIAFEVGGRLAQLPVLEGQQVTRGTLLAALDETDFKLAVREAEVQLKLARQDLERKRQVLKQRGIARSVVDDAQSLYELQSVRLDQARERLAKSRLTAPFAGTIARRYVDNFVSIQPNTAVARLQDLSKLLVVVHVPETLLATATEEQVVEMYATFNFAPEQRYALNLHENRGEADSVAHTYEVSLLMENPDGVNILPGMSATVHILLRDGDSPKVTNIPATALVSNPDKSFHVWVFDPQTQEVHKRAVVVGAPNLDGVPVLEGLQGGEHIVVTGADFLQPGMKVSPLEAI